MTRQRRWLWMSIFAAAGVTTLLVIAKRSDAGRASRSPLIVDRVRHEVRLRATVHSSRFSRFFVQPGHHAIVWNGGRARFGALFATDSSDREVRIALASLGAEPGENLTAETWTERNNRRSREPDKRVEGAPLDVYVEWAGSGGAIPLSRLISEGGRPAGFDFRFGGNERFQRKFKSGCIVCNYSCPGGAIGNRNRTIREEVKPGVLFTVHEQRFPVDGSTVTVTLRLRSPG